MIVSASKATWPYRPALLALLLGGLAGCPSEKESFELSLLLARDTACGDSSPRTQTRLPQSQFAVRLTFMYRKPDQLVGPANLREFELLCDRVVVPNSTDEIVVDTAAAGTQVAVRVEAFEPSRKLVRFGDNLSFNIFDPDVTVHLRPAGKPSCMEAARRLHAFHTSTLLPNGQVLLVGGLAADAAGGDNLAGKQEAFASGGVELYDPSGLRFLVTNPAEIPPRAFHRAVLLPSPPEGPYKVLLLGGLTPGDAGGAVVRLRVQNTKLPFVVSPHEDAVAAEAALLQITPDPSAPRIEYLPQPDLPRAMFPETVLSNDGQRVLLVPGAASYEATASAITGFSAAAGGPQARWIQLADPPVVGEAVAMRKIRVGHAAARIGPDRYVVVGGTMDGPQGDASAEVAAAFGAAQTAFANATPTVDYGMAWHTLTPIGRSDREATLDPPRAALLAGGYVLSWDGAEGYRFATPEVSPLVPPQATVQLVEDGSPKLSMRDRTSLGGFARTAYHAAVRLHDGRVLVTGGNGGDQTFDARDQAVLFTYDGSDIAIDPLSAELQLETPRYGHRATRLLDNTILITGGITLKSGDVPVVTTAAELLAPREGATSEDYPFDRPPGEAKQPCRLFGEQTPAAQSSSAMKIVTRPSPRTSSGRRIRAVRAPTGRLVLRIADGTRSR